MINSEQWEKIEQELSGSFGSVKLSLDGKEIHLTKKLVAENQLGIVIYIDGSYSLAWGMVDHEFYDSFVTKVWKQRNKYYHPPKQQKQIIKIWGKREAKKRYDFSKKHIWYQPLFEKFGPLKRQYQKLEGLEIISIGYTGAADA